MLENVNCIVVNGTTLKAFNSNNRWVNIGTVDQLNTSLFGTSGTNYPILNTSCNYVLYDYTLVGTSSTGSPVYESEEIPPNIGITDLTNITVNNVDKLKATLPAFIPKDTLTTSDIIYAYSSDPTFKPYVDSVSFSKTNIHTESVSFNIKSIYNYNENIKYRYKVNSGQFCDWSPLHKPYNGMVGEVYPSMLSLGANTITLEVSNEDGTKVTTHTINNAITVSDDTPEVLIVTADSDQFKLHFKVIDNNIMDTVSYRLLLNNSKLTNYVLSDWSSLVKQPIEPIHYIDTNKIVSGENNTITIEYKDNYGVSNTATYSFVGKYKNMVFANESGEYYSTDKGLTLKTLQIDKLIAGAESATKRVVIKNNNDIPMTGLILEPVYKSQVSGVNIKLSKTVNPFITQSRLDYGNRVILPNEEISFYIKIDTSIKSSGVLLFDINANAKAVRQ